MKGDDEILHHFLQLALWPCVACGIEGVQLHHAKGGSMKERGVHVGKAQRSSDWMVLPVCETHHTGTHGIHNVGVLSWELLYGAQAKHLDRVCEVLAMDVWERAGHKRFKPYRRSHKIVPRTAA